MDCHGHFDVDCHGDLGSRFDSVFKFTLQLAFHVIHRYVWNPLISVPFVWMSMESKDINGFHTLTYTWILQSRLWVDFLHGHKKGSHRKPNF